MLSATATNRNRQHCETGAYWSTFHPAPVPHMIGGPYVVQPLAQPVYPAVTSWGVNVVPVSSMAVGVVMNGKKKKEEKGDTGTRAVTRTGCAATSTRARRRSPTTIPTSEVIL